jgi:uncharacterized protein (TIGR03382 family)
MNRSIMISAALSAMGIAGVAHAETPRSIIKWTDPARQGATWTQPTPDTVSHVIYLNNCQPNGCMLTPGNDSTQNQSGIINNQVKISAYSGSSTQWDQIVNCVKQTYAPFNVQIVTTRPTSGDYHMAIVAGSASEAGMGQGVLGVSPFSCGYIPNSISFSFANEEPSGIDDMCWTVAQETAHSWGLDHKFDDKSPMTYLQSGPAMKTFQNTTMSCGEYSARACNCSYANTGTSGENDYQLVLATFGSSAPDTTPPMVSIQSPQNGMVVMPGFTITANISDDGVVASAQLKIDGNAVGSALVNAPWTWTAPTLSGGTHHIEVDATDGGNNTASAAIDVSIGGGSCSSGNSCPMGQDCINNVCVAGPGTPGGLGSTCTANSDCSSGQCAGDGTGAKYCVEPCNPAMNGCPSGFSCDATSGNAGVCWPNPNSGHGGCSTSGGDGAIAFAMLALVGMLITRKRQ